MTDLKPMPDKEKRDMALKCFNDPQFIPFFYARYGHSYRVTVEHVLGECVSQAQGGWLPIESAPQETDVLVCFVVNEEYGPVVGEAKNHQEDGDEGWYLAGVDPSDYHGHQVYPTHWQPLPKPPTKD